MDEKQIELVSSSSNIGFNIAAVKPVSVRTLLFKYATRKEKVVFFLGFLCIVHYHILIVVSIISGILTPLSYMFYGPLLDETNSYEIDFARIKFFLLGVGLCLFGASIFAFFERLCLGYFAGIRYYCVWPTENITRQYRDHYVAALFQRDVEFLEQFSPGRLGQRFSEESSRIVDGLGPGLGSLVRALSSLFSGIVIGMTLVRIVSLVDPRIGCWLFWLWSYLRSLSTLVSSSTEHMETMLNWLWRNTKMQILLQKSLFVISKLWRAWVLKISLSLDITKWSRSVVKKLLSICIDLVFFVLEWD